MESYKQIMLKRAGRHAFGIGIIPVISIVVSLVICAVSGTKLFVSEASLQNLIYGISFLSLIAFAVSTNLHSGRFDFSIGSMLVFCSTTFLILARDYIHNLPLLVVITVLLGALCGLFSGVLYVVLRLPSMIISLGVALLYEAFAYIVTSGMSRSILTGQNIEGISSAMNNYVGNSNNFTWIILLTLTAVLLMVFLFNYTKFGYDYHALQSGQKIAVDTGIKETANALWCYVISGALVGLAATFFACKTSSTRPDSMLNFASVGVMFDAFCPLFFADYIRRYCKKEVAILIGVSSYEVIQLAFGNINSVHTDFTSTVYGIINSLILVTFLIYLNNEKVVNHALSFKWLREKKNSASKA